MPHAISSTLSLNHQPPQKSILIYTPVPLQQIIQLGIFFLQTYLCNVHFSLYKILFFQINTKICTIARAKVVSFLVSFVKFQISCMISLKNLQLVNGVIRKSVSIILRFCNKYAFGHALWASPIQADQQKNLRSNLCILLNTIYSLGSFIEIAVAHALQFPLSVNLHRAVAYTTSILCLFYYYYFLNIFSCVEKMYGDYQVTTKNNKSITLFMNLMSKVCCLA